MAFHIEDIKKFIDEYFKDNKSDIKVINSKIKTEKIIVSKDLYILQNQLEEIASEQGVNIRLNPSVFSEGILASIDKSADNHFKAVDYQYNLFYHLTLNYDLNISLFEYINSFVNSYKKQLSFNDIKITESGATRIFTNLRFALNDLRNLGLIHRKGKEGNRVNIPTLFGLLVLIYLLNNDEYFNKKTIYKTPLELKLKNYSSDYYPSYFTYDNILINAIKRIKEVDIMEILGSLPNEIDDKSKEIIREISNRYSTFVLSFLEISAEGIKIKNKSESVIKDFVKLVENEKDYPQIHGRLLSMIKEFKTK